MSASSSSRSFLPAASKLLQATQSSCYNNPRIFLATATRTSARTTSVKNCRRQDQQGRGSCGSSTSSSSSSASTSTLVKVKNCPAGELHVGQHQTSGRTQLLRPQGWPRPTDSDPQSTPLFDVFPGTGRSRWPEEPVAMAYGHQNLFRPATTHQRTGSLVVFSHGRGDSTRSSSLVHHPRFFHHRPAPISAGRSRAQQLSLSQMRAFSSSSSPAKVKVMWIYEKDGQKIGPCEVKPHQTMLDCAHDHDIEIEGACGGNAACSTCHVYLSETDYNKFPEPDEDELDMLDLAAGLKEGTSRLCCQLRARHIQDQSSGGSGGAPAAPETLVLTIPKETNNFFDM
ncbi:unnamed protein product [Amoebophrya sp. A120]|nr:unnamed protein product [Amoebophrya sp. A120]|eukprot:GSA120T00010099001.1